MRTGVDGGGGRIWRCPSLELLSSFSFLSVVGLSKEMKFKLYSASSYPPSPSPPPQRSQVLQESGIDEPIDQRLSQAGIRRVFTPWRRKPSSPESNVVVKSNVGGQRSPAGVIYSSVSRATRSSNAALVWQLPLLAFERLCLFLDSI